MIGSFISAVGCALNAGWYAWHENPFSLGVAVFCGLSSLVFAVRS